MVRADVIDLIGENPEAHGIFDPPSEGARTVFCEVRSVGFNEYYTALSHGLNPTVVFRLTERDDYKGEKILTWNGKRYRVVRTYTDNEAIELTAEEITADRGAHDGETH